MSVFHCNVIDKSILRTYGHVSYFDKLCLLVSCLLVVKGGVSRGELLEAREEVGDDLGQGQHLLHPHPVLVDELRVDLLAPALPAQRQHVAQHGGRADDGAARHRLQGLLHLRLVRPVVGVRHRHLVRLLPPDESVRDGGRGDDDGGPVLGLEALREHLHVQHAQEAQAVAAAESAARLHRHVDGRVV